MAGSSWPDLVAGRTAKASEAEAKFDWLEGSLLPMNSGTTTDLAYDLGSETKRWKSAYLGGINPTTTAGGVAIGTTTANASALLDIAGAKALLLPRLTTAERDALTPVNGMFIYNSTLGQFQIYKGGAWSNLGGTVFRTNPTAATSTTAAATTTALSIASGGGRINGIAVFGLSGKPEISVVLDGVTVFSWTANTSGSHTYAVCPNGNILKMDPSMTSLAVEYPPVTPATAGTSPIPYLGWEFATSCAIYMRDTSGSGPATIGARFIYSSLV